MLLEINWDVPAIVGTAIGCLLVACGFIIGLMFLLGYVTFRNLFVRRKEKTPEEHPLHSVLCPNSSAYAEKLAAAMKELEKQPFEWVSAESEDGLKLSARYYKAAGAKRTVICMHGYASNAVRDFAMITPYYFEKGYNVLLATERAHGESEGHYTGLGVLEAKDIKVWVSEIAKIAPETEIFIHGVSIGAVAAALASAASLPGNVKGMIVDSAFTRIWDIMCFQIRELYKLTPFPILQIAELFARRFMKIGFHRERTIDAVKQAEVPILFIHGENDRVAPVYMGEALYNACTAPKAKFFVENAGYAEGMMTATEKYIAAVDAFMNDPRAKAEPAAEPFAAAEAAPAESTESTESTECADGAAEPAESKTESQQE